MSQLKPMARGPYRVEITCPLTFEGPLHVGTGERLSVETDAPLLMDVDGRFYLPGSSVRGVLRDACERDAALLGVGAAPLLRLLGPARGRVNDDRLSRLEVLDVEFDGVTTQVIDRVRLERDTGTAAPGGKFDVQIAWVKGGLLRLVYHGDGPEDQELRLIEGVFALLRQGVLAFGGGSGGGLGMVSSSGVEHTMRAHDRRQPVQLAAFLQQRLGSSPVGSDGVEAPPGAGASSRLAASADHQPAATEAPPPWCWLELVLDIGFDGPMLVSTSRPKARKRKEGEKEPDATWFSDPEGRPWLPGTSLRGGLHAHADRMVNTLECPELASRLFGELRGADVGGRGIVQVGWGLGDRQGSDVSVALNHVAIDRLTGFSAPGRLFSCEALASPVFRHRLLLRWDAGDSEQEAAAFLMLLCLRDLDQRLLGVGSRTTRGYGEIASVKLERASARWVDRDGGAPTASTQAVGSGELVEMIAQLDVTTKLSEAWSAKMSSRTRDGGEA